MRILELFSGIGGCAAAVGDSAEIVAAVDINRTALEVYRRNFSHPTRVCTVESLPTDWLRQCDADLWWLSPPCQPYTRRGHGRDVQDPRAAGLLAVIDRLPRVRPASLALENVPGFEGSQSHHRLRTALENLGYRVAERRFCPTEVGLPGRRRRFYLMATRGELQPWPEPVGVPISLADALDDCPHPELKLRDDIAVQYEGALDVVDAEDPKAVCSCFTSAYGRSYVRSGSYLRISDDFSRGTQLRRFAPAEILRLLGFPATFTLPEDLPVEKAWPLVGNSLSVVAVKMVLATLGCRPQATGCAL